MNTLQKIENKVRHQIGQWRFGPKVNVEKGGSLKRLGTEYRGWCFEDTESLQGNTILSAGLGEDASFDVEFARAFGARVIIVDPTPRAVAHFRQIETRVGQPSVASYVAGDKQPVEAYPLDGIEQGQLQLIDKALWTEQTKLKFYMPPNPDHVSHSIVNFQQDYSTDSPAIEVEAITIADVLSDAGLSDLELVKLDIEGAEVPVLADMMEKGIKPRQLLIEFDELIKPSVRARQNYEVSDRLLRDNGYRCRYFDGMSNFLYVC